MDTEILIKLVRERKCLWDKREPHYHCRDIQRTHWKEISKIMKIGVDVIKKRWRNIRDTFRKVCKKSVQSRSSDAADEVFGSKWPYFTNLLFLKGVMTTRTPSNNTQVNIDVPFHKVEIEEEEVQDDEGDNFGISP
ncbi:hypothetical protein NQ318_001406, partial [Aromia moschata]